MQNSDKLIKGKSPLARVVGNFAYVNTKNEMLFLATGLARGSVAHFLGCFRDIRALRTYPIHCVCYYLEERNEGLYLRKTRSVLPSKA